MDAKRVEMAVSMLDKTGIIRKDVSLYEYREEIEILVDLAKSYLTAIKSGVPEEKPKWRDAVTWLATYDNKKVSCAIEDLENIGFNTCREQMLPLIVERDREILELHTYIDNAFGKQTKGKPIVERVHDIVMELETVRNENQALLARVKDVEGIKSVLVREGNKWARNTGELYDLELAQAQAISKWLEGEGE